MSPPRLYRRLTFTLALASLTLLPLLPYSFFPPSSNAQELLHVTSNVSYNIRPDAGPVHVSWQVQLDNQDPQTERRDSGTIFFYDSLNLPVLRGLANLAARSGSTPLSASVDPASDGPLVTAIVSFDRRLFFRDTYTFSLDYDLPAARDDSLLVTPHYLFLPAVSIGDQSTVSINAPADQAWEVNLEPADCPGPGPVFTCQASSPSRIHLAAFAEVSRPDATVTLPIPAPVPGVNITLTYFQGEEAWAQHLQQLASAALPVLAELYGFPYPGPPSVNIAERGRQVILGYEGLTSCEPQTACEIAVSPIADDVTILHELAHLWSDIYAKRWLAEGFAELTARKTAEQLGPALVQGNTDPSFQSTLDLRLDEWGDVSYLIAATSDQQATEQAGYDRSLRFLRLLEDTVGLTALQGANAHFAQNDLAADSQRFLDALEDASGQNLDRLFLQWVFPDSFAPVLEQRRQARDRLAALSAAVQAEGLSSSPPAAIQADIAAWNFDSALAALDEAEAGLQLYLELKGRLASLREAVQAAGLTFPRTIDEAIAGWRFNELDKLLADAETALVTYARAREKVDEPRSFLQRLGLWGRDPQARLQEAAAAFAAGDFLDAITSSEDAYDMVDGASTAALIRLLILLAVLAVLAGSVAAFWLWRRRQRLL